MKWVICIFLTNIFFVTNENITTWSHKQLFPSDKIPDNGLNPRKTAVRDRIVAYHNFFRTKVKPSASNMLQMSWHCEAAQQAQKYADQCRYLQHNDPSENTVPRLGSCGQNIFVASQKAPWFTAIKSWYIEYKDFAYGSPIRNLSEVGHYTQMVWATSHKVGCGVTYCKGGPWGTFYNYICHYCPGGNVNEITQYPYKKGASCADCPEHCSKQKLCTNTCSTRDVYNNCFELKRDHDICPRGICNATCMCEGKIHQNYPWH